jgi:hypothetical protein
MVGLVGYISMEDSAAGAFV